MSCSCSYNPCLCGSGTVPITSCAGEDPGLEVRLRHVVGLDRALRIRRLQNSAGVLVSRPDGSNGYRIFFSDDLALAYDTYSVGVGDKFSYLVASMGDGGFHRRIEPNEAGYLKANADGTFEIGEAPEATVPDPLSVTSLTAGTATITTLTVSGVPTFTGLDEDTIQNFVGLNSSNELVKGVQASATTAMYFENTDLVNSALTPNENVNPNGLLTFGNRIFDPHEIASVVNSQNIVIEEDGLYTIEWLASVQGFNTGSDSTVNNYDPEIWLALGDSNAVVNKGQYAWQSPRAGGVIAGKHTDQIEAGTGVWFKAGPECRTPSGIKRLQVIITKLS